MQTSGSTSGLLIIGVGLLIALAAVLTIHKVVAQHFQYGRERKTILSMEVVAFGLLMAGFVLGEVLKVIDLFPLIKTESLTSHGFVLRP
jgi:hypothetical protein